MCFCFCDCNCSGPSVLAKRRHSLNGICMEFHFVFKVALKLTWDILWHFTLWMKHWQHAVISFRRNPETLQSILSSMTHCSCKWPAGWKLSLSLSLKRSNIKLPTYLPTCCTTPIDQLQNNQLTPLSFSCMLVYGRPAIHAANLIYSKASAEKSKKCRFFGIFQHLHTHTHTHTHPMAATE